MLTTITIDRHHRVGLLRRRGASLLTALLLAATALGAADAPPTQAIPATTDAASLNWLSGCWSGSNDGVFSTEMWTNADGGGMVGLHKDVARGKMSGFEFLRIVPVADSGLCYLASPGGAPPTSFCLLSQDAQRVVFENKAHDFPQRIVYARTGDKMVARIEGTINGQERSAEWAWERCPASSL